jgi:hypothetical protein
MADWANYIVLGASCGTCLLLAASVFLKMSRMQRRIDVFEKHTHKQTSMLNSGVLAIGQRVLELEQRLASLRKQHSDTAPNAEDYSYSRARALLEQGLNPETVATTCNLSLSEVELMQLMRAPRPSESKHSAIS